MSSPASPPPPASPPQPAAPPPASSPKLSRPVKILLFVILPLLFLVLLTIAILIVVTLARGEQVSETAASPAGQNVTVEVPNARLNFQPSPDDQVHVAMTGNFSGARPTISLASAGEGTTLSGGCSTDWFFSHCDVTLSVMLPADLPLAVHGKNGSVTLADLTGRITVDTANGRIDSRGSAGALDLRTTNGTIQVHDASGAELFATTTNGSVDLELTAPPTTLEARSTNGSITVRLPNDDTDYVVTAATVNGRVDTGSVPSNSAADRAITAETTNGSVTVERSGH